MPALENNLFVVFGVLLILAALAAVGWAAGKPVLRRAWRYLCVWWERDKIAEAEAKRSAVCRKQAEQELRETCGDTLTDTQEFPAAQTGRQPRTDAARKEPDSQQLQQKQ